MAMIVRSIALFSLAALFWPTAGNAIVFTYTDESEYRAKLASLSLEHWSENFDWSTGATIRPSAAICAPA